ncbi:hypothetical protein FIBSPDRAFT_1048783 [Athelia psychrophila]|uniref:Uncharacterized protein n=1 Tax=Athelia psychrophila TaxID=1759441 RepID=A0A166D939_9AGAM|nr:hypothetical protein FIBSPDRAFT_1048783 [Fibularhizoctonia sp. CBS 109695]
MIMAVVYRMINAVAISSRFLRPRKDSERAEVKDKAGGELSHDEMRCSEMSKGVHVVADGYEPTAPKLADVETQISNHDIKPKNITYPFPDRFLAENLAGYDIAPALLSVILSEIEAAGSIEKVAENHHLGIIVTYETLTPKYERVLGRLVAILTSATAKNRSNPDFDQ